MLKEILDKVEQKIDKNTNIDIQRKTRKSIVNKLKGSEMIKKISNRDTTLGDSPLDKSSKQYILRKGFTVKRYYDQVLKPLLEEMNKTKFISW